MRRHLFLVGAFVTATLAATRSGKADVCYELVNAIPHPAEYGPACYLDLQNLSWVDLLCIAQPHCCTPILCQTIPACWTTTLARHAYVAEFECNITVEDALQQWLNGYLFLNHNAISPYINALYAEGSPLSSEMLQLLHGLGESALTRDIDWPTDFQLAEVRVINESTSANIFAKGVAHGRTFGNAIVLSEDRYRDITCSHPNPNPNLPPTCRPNGAMPHLPTVRQFECQQDGISASWFDSFKTLIHEIAHTVQYRNLGANGFYALYTLETVFEDGEEKQTSLEHGAADLAADFEARCMAAIGTCDTPEAPPSPSGEALSASQTVRLNDRSEIWTEGGALGICGSTGQLYPCYGRARAAGSGGMYVGVNALTGRLQSAGPLELRDRVIVEDSVEAAGAVIKGNGVAIRGEVLESAPPPSDPFSGFAISFPAFGGSVGIEPDQSVVLEPGSYGDLTIKPRAALHLASGTYYFRSANFDVDSLVAIENSGAPTRIFVFDELQFKGIVYGDPANTLIYVRNGGVELTGELHGTLLVPNGKANIYGSAALGSPSHFGAVAARAIELHQDRILVHIPFAHSWTPPAYAPPPSATLTAAVQVTSSWSTGYCATILISNGSNLPSTWSLTLSMNGSSIASAWNAQFSDTSGIVVVQPNQSWNGTIPPHTTMNSVGFCATRPTPDFVSSVVSVNP